MASSFEQVVHVEGMDCPQMAADRGITQGELQDLSMEASSQLVIHYRFFMKSDSYHTC